MRIISRFPEKMKADKITLDKRTIVRIIAGMRNLRTQLVIVSDIFGNARGIGRKRVSTIVLGQGSKLDAVATGSADVTTKTWERAMQYYSDNWPKNAVWPVSIARPTPQQPTRRRS